MQDVFIEYLVKRKNGPRVMLAKIGIVVATIIVAILAMAFSGQLGPFSVVGPLVAIGALYGGFYLITSMSVEFEYAVTNGEMDIDRIVAQRKRRRLATVDCRKVEAFGRYKPDEHAKKSYQTRVIACDSPDSGDVWYCVASLKDKGMSLVVFNANEKMLGAIKPFLPRPVMHEAFKMGVI